MKYKTKFSMTNIGYDPLDSFLAIKKQFPKSFFFQTNNLQGEPHLTVIGLEIEEKIKIDFNEESGDFFKRLENILNDKTKNNFPYESGGAFGCIGYEMIREIEPKLKECGYFKRKVANERLLEIFISKDLIIFEHKKGLIHFTLKNISTDTKLLEKKKNAENKLNAKLEKFDGYETDDEKNKFYEKVKKIKSHIKIGDIFQAVLSMRFEKKIESDALEIFKEVKNKCRAAYHYYFDFTSSSFFGASPETFVKLNRQKMETHPIAGTRPRGVSVRQDQNLERQLRYSTKENAEHLMLVDLARNDLGRVAKSGSVIVKTFRHLLRLPNVMHLVSKVEGEISPTNNVVDVFKACFPAGTLSGAPKVRAMEIIAEHETRPRGFYGGAVVAFDFEGNFDSCIAIRSIEVKDQVAILRAGAGIVSDSNPMKEYEEIQHKLKSLVECIETVESLKRLGKENQQYNSLEVTA